MSKELDPTIRRTCGETEFLSTNLSTIMILQGDTGLQFRLGHRECDELYAMLGEMRERRYLKSQTEEFIMKDQPSDFPTLPV